MEKQFVAYEQFATYKIAMKLKEKGFDEPCFGQFTSYHKKLLVGDLLDYTKINKELECLAPLWQQVIDWLEDHHNIIMSRNVNYTSKNGQLLHVGHNYRLTRVGQMGDPIFTQEMSSRITALEIAIEHALTVI